MNDEKIKASALSFLMEYELKRGERNRTDWAFDTLVSLLKEARR